MTQLIVSVRFKWIQDGKDAAAVAAAHKAFSGMCAGVEGFRIFRTWIIAIDNRIERAQRALNLQGAPEARHFFSSPVPNRPNRPKK